MAWLITAATQAGIADLNDSVRFILLVSEESGPLGMPWQGSEEGIGDVIEIIIRLGIFE